jgi:hypothetical protein
MRALIAVLAACLASCQHDPYTTNYTRKRPKTDLCGTYVPDAATRELIAQVGHYPAAPTSITLLADGFLSIANVPDWWNTPFGESQGEFDSGTGGWNLQQHQQWWAISAHFGTTAHFASLQFRTDSFATEFMLVGQRPPYKLHLVVGDPDAGRAMEFERAQPDIK